MAKDRKYWQERFQQVEDATHSTGIETYAEVEKQCIRAQRTLEAQIRSWYGRFADNNKISMQEARKLLSTKELQEFKWDVKDYIKYGKENALNAEWMKQLENASARFHISRLEALKIQTQQTMEAMFGNQVDSVDAAMRSVYTEGYYHTAYEMQKGFNIGFDIASIDNKKLTAIINKPWAVDGLNFSDRIWQNRSKLINEVHTQITQMVLLGQSPDKAISNLARRMQTTKNQAGRLIMTESAYFGSLAQKNSFNDLNVEQYEYDATLDSKTSEICQELDGQVFDMKDFEPGVNAPPMHVWCRSCTVPYFADDFDIVGERAARGEDGKIYYVPGNIKYKDWKRSFVEGGSKDALDNVIPGDMMKIGTGSLKNSFGEGHTSVIQSLLSKAPQNVQDAWNNCVDDFKVLSTDTKGIACYDPVKRGIEINLNNVTVDRYADIGRGKELSKNAYETVFHELGHNMASLAASRNGGYVWDDYADIFRSTKHTRDIIGREGTEKIGYTLTEMIQKEANENIKAVWNELKEEAAKNGLKKNSVEKYKAYVKIRTELKALPLNVTHDVSDIWEGCTDGAVKAFSGHLSNDRAYWKNHTVGTEAFAEMYSSTITNAQSLEQIKKYFPKSYEVFNEMLDEIGR